MGFRLKWEPYNIGSLYVLSSTIKIDSHRLLLLIPQASLPFLDPNLTGESENGSQILHNILSIIKLKSTQQQICPTLADACLNFNISHIYFRQ